MKAIGRGLSTLALLFVTGCNTDPEGSVLPAGSLAVIAGPGRTYLGGSLAPLDPGVMVRVGSDPGYIEQTAEEVADDLARFQGADRERVARAGPRRWRAGDEVARYREVSVTVESGESRDRSGTVRRLHLRPAK